jgi:hypothetical protein
MKSLKRFFTRMFNSVTRRTHDERIREEIEGHIARQTAEILAPVYHPGVEGHTSRSNCRIET